MFITILVLFQLSVLSTANPFNKYPFVFLLDIGNEELDNTESEQIRLSVPGGSLAVRYPASGNGNTITHVRVSGIDFGTDLKANVIEGGPGDKYVVLLFKGNEGKVYDAVVTIQTLPDDIKEDESAPIEKSESDFNRPENDQENEDYVDVKEDKIDNANDSSEVADDSDNTYEESKLPSAPVYSYLKSSNDYDDGGKDSNNNDIHIPQKSLTYIDRTQNTHNKYSADDNIDDDIETRKTNKKTDNNDEDYDGTDEARKYETLDPHKYIEEGYNEIPNTEETGDNELEFQDEIDQMFNDEEVHGYPANQRTYSNTDFNNDDSNTVVS